MSEKPYILDSGGKTHGSCEPPALRGEIKFYEPPNYAGSYRLGGAIGTQFVLSKKPCWFHRKMVKLILGWEWKDE